MGFDIGLLRSGLFCYNGVLAGLALAAFDDQIYYAPTLIASVVFASLSSVIFVVMGKLLVPYQSPPLTYPFNLATIVLLLAVADMGRVDYASVGQPGLPEYKALRNLYHL